jgi:hypothetical protein
MKMASASWHERATKPFEKELPFPPVVKVLPVEGAKVGGIPVEMLAPFPLSRRYQVEPPAVTQLLVDAENEAIDALELIFAVRGGH